MPSCERSASRDEEDRRESNRSRDQRLGVRPKKRCYSWSRGHVPHCIAVNKDLGYEHDLGNTLARVAWCAALAVVSIMHSNAPSPT
jgi:hypothetical protein